MENFIELLLQNKPDIISSITDYAEKEGYLEHITKIKDRLGLSIESVFNLILSVNKSGDINKIDDQILKYLNLSDLSKNEFHDTDILLICIKYCKYSFYDFINSNKFNDPDKSHYYVFITRLFDSIEVNLLKLLKATSDSISISKTDTDENNRYQIVVENSLNPIMIIDSSGNVIDMNTSARKLFYEMKEEYFFQGNVEDTLPWLTPHYNKFVKNSNPSSSFEHFFHTKKGIKYFDVKLIKTNTYDVKRNEIAIVMNNITGYKKMTKEISESKLRYQSLFKNMFEYCSYNKLVINKSGVPVDFTVLDVNDALIKGLGLKRDEIIGRCGSEIFPFLDVSDFNWLGNFAKAALNGENIRIKELYLESINKWYSVSIYSSEDGYFAFVYSDISEKKQAEENVSKLAYFDVLTGLPNSRQLDEKIKDTISYAKIYDKKFAVMFIDITNFKKINNTLGHKTGDAMLKQIAERLTVIAATDNIVSRLSGDKFVVVYKDMNNEEDVAWFAENITNVLKPPFNFNDHEFFIEVNIGISIYPDDADNMHTLKRNADTAMYCAKKSPDLRYLFHTKDMNEKALRNLILEADLRKAINKNQLSLHFQPLVNINTGNIMGFEALLRWSHPVSGAVSPAEFIPIAEENGLIVPIGEWVLKHAVLQCKEWHERGYHNIYVAVNVSINQLQQRNFVERVRQILFETELDPVHLRIEITESVYMQHIDTILETLVSLKRMGIRLSLDDFGTGYSSLNYLNKLPINTLKIDKSFIKHMDSNRDYAILIKAIIEMAHSLNLDVVAEGVETYEELKVLREHQCDKIQGYLFSRPIPPENVDDILSVKRNLYNLEDPQ